MTQFICEFDPSCARNPVTQPLKWENIDVGHFGSSNTRSKYIFIKHLPPLPFHPSGVPANDLKMQPLRDVGCHLNREGILGSILQTTSCYIHVSMAVRRAEKSSPSDVTLMSVF